MQSSSTKQKLRKSSLKWRTWRAFSEFLSFGLSLTRRKGSARSSFLQRDVSSQHSYRKIPNRVSWWRRILTGIRSPGFLLGFFIFIVVIQIYLLLFSNFFRISNFQFTGLKLIERDRFIASTQTIMDERIWSIFPGDSILFLNASRLIHDLQKSYGLHRLEIKKAIIPKTLFISLQEKPIGGILHSNGKYYYLDEQGQLITEVSKEQIDFSDYAYFRTTQSVPENTDQIIFPALLLTVAREFEAQLQKDHEATFDILFYEVTESNKVVPKLKPPVSKVEEVIPDTAANSPEVNATEEAYLESFDPDPTTRLYDLSATTRQGWKILFGSEVILMNRNIETSYLKVKRALDYAKKNKLSSPNIVIDIRFPSRAYIYKQD